MPGAAPANVRVWDVCLALAAEVSVPGLIRDGWQLRVEQSSNMTLINSTNRQMLCLFTEKSSPHLWTQDVYCQMRILIRESLDLLGGVELHAASFRWHDRTISVLGDKGAGKSTVSYFLKLMESAEYVAGDRMLVWKEGEELRCSGVIASYRLTPGDMGLFPLTSRHQAVMDECTRQIDRPDVYSRGKVRLSPARLASALGIPVVRVAKPEIVWFLAPGPEPYRLRRLTSEEALSCFNRYTLNRTPGVEGNRVLQALSTLACYALEGRGELPQLVQFRPA
jgi:hypothetical protein